MLKLFIPLAFLLSPIVYSQEVINKKGNSTPVDSTVISGSHKIVYYNDGSTKYLPLKKEIPILNKATTNEDEITRLRQYINDIETKVSHVKSNPNQHNSAQEIRWYERMDQEIAIAEEKIEELKKAKND